MTCYGENQSREWREEGRNWYFKQGGQGKPLLKMASIGKERLFQMGQQQVHRPQARRWWST